MPFVVVYVGWAVLFCTNRVARLLLAHCFPWATKGLKTGCRVRPEADTTDGVLQPLESAIAGAFVPIRDPMKGGLLF